MPPKDLKPLLLLFLLSIFLWACNNEEECCLPSPQIADEEWLSVSIKRDREVNFAPQEVLLTFDSDTTFSLQLDVNRCGGNMNLDLETGRFEASTISCTYACCDSPYSEFLVDFLAEADAYELRTQELIILKGDNRAVFKIKD